MGSPASPLCGSFPSVEYYGCMKGAFTQQRPHIWTVSGCELERTAQQRITQGPEHFMGQMCRMEIRLARLLS